MDNSFTTKKTSRSFVAISSLAAAALLAASMGSSLASYAVQPTVDLGLAEPFAVLAGSGISNTGPTTASGSAGANFGSSPTGTFTGDVLVTTSGTKYTAVDAAVTAAKVDLTTAYNDAAGRTPATTVTADLGGQTLTAGVYKSASSLAVTGTLTLDAENDPDAVFIFQAGSTLTSASSATIALVNGADACNVFWQVGSSATFGTDTVFVGHVLALTSITANTRATFQGQLLAQNGAVTLDTNTITNNLCQSVTPSASPSASASETPAAPPAAEERVTDTGGQLPNTDAFNWLTPLAIGLGVIALATASYLIWRRRNPESK
jgi:LPXTG-motif cell wall-anchored protein